MATTKETAAAKTATTPPVPLTLQQKFIKLRKAVPSITQKAHSDGVKYKFAKIFDVYQLLTPAMNEFGVNFDIVGEQATRHSENGDPIYYSNFTQHTRNGDRNLNGDVQAKHPDWDPVECPTCGRKCWKHPEADRLAKEQGAKMLCTECAIKAGLLSPFRKEGPNRAQRRRAKRERRK